MKAALLFAACAAWAQTGNVIPLGPSARVELITPSTIRVDRGKLPPVSRIAGLDDVEHKVTDTGSHVRIDTSELAVTFDRAAATLSISAPSGLNLYQETASSPDGLELAVRDTERFYGLGPRPETRLSARGLLIPSPAPFFISSRGYGWWSATPLRSADMASQSPAKVTLAAQAETFTYYFSFGPSIKEIFGERHKVVPAIETPTAAQLQLIPPNRLPAAATRLPLFQSASLCADAAALVHASLSGQPLPAFDLGRYHAAPLAEFRRALRLGVFSPVMLDSAPSDGYGDKLPHVEAARTLRNRLSHFLLTYADEVRYRGYPVIHPLQMQFPRDPEAAERLDAYMFGDEFLLAPVCDGASKREIYLPMGNWTDWNTGQVHAGRRTVSLDVPADGLIILVKNGSLIPLAGVQEGDPVELHYFPRNGGEFFLYEPDVADYSQAHAGPAGNVYRVEIESKVRRRYEWVLHHMDKPVSVAEPDGEPFTETTTQGPLAPRSWRYDAALRQLRIGVESAAGSDVIVNARY